LRGRCMKPARLNIFHVFSIVCVFLLIGYLWLVYLPLYIGAEAYTGVKTMVTVVSIMLAAAAVLIVLSTVSRS